MTETPILDDRAVSEIEAQLNSGSLLLPLRVEGWHMSLSDGGWHIKNAYNQIVMTVRFVPVEIETGKPALEGNAPARHTAALLNSIPALCATVRAGAEELAKAWKVADELRAENDRLSTGLMNLYHVITNEQCDRKVALGMATSAVSSLQSQLEQLRAENERLLSLYNSAWLWVQQRVKHPNSGLPPAAMTLIEMLPLLNQRAIQLCKDKAAEWSRQYVNAEETNTNEDGEYYRGQADAARELAADLEKL